MSRLKIITNPWKLWRLKLEAKLTKNSRCWNISENGAKITRIQIGGYNYMYLSPRGKIRMSTMAGVDTAPMYEWAFTDWLKDVMDKLDTSLGRMIMKLAKKPTPIKPFSEYGSLDYQINSMFVATDSVSEKDRKKRKDKFDKIRNGSLASKIDKFDTHEPVLKHTDSWHGNPGAEAPLNEQRMGFYSEIDLNPDKYNSSEDSDRL